MSQFMLEHRFFILVSGIIWGASYLMRDTAPLLTLTLSLVTFACWIVVLGVHGIQQFTKSR